MVGVVAVAVVVVVVAVRVPPSFNIAQNDPKVRVMQRKLSCFFGIFCFWILFLARATTTTTTTTPTTTKTASVNFGTSPGAPPDLLPSGPGRIPGYYACGISVVVQARLQTSPVALRDYL